MAKFVLTAQLQLQAPKNVASVVNQIQNQLRGVKVNVEAQGTAKTQREIQKLTTATDQASKSAGRMGKAFDASLRRFTALAIATRAVSLFTNTLAGSVREAISFERELIKISQVTGKTMSDLRFLTDTITDLSKTFGVASSSLLNVSRILSQAGFNAKQTEIALSTLAKTELAPTFDNITQTAEGAVAIFNQFRKGAEALEAQLGAINAVAGKFAVEAGDLISVLRRTGGVFQASGGDLNELIALFTSVRATTRESAESIATGLRTIFTRIQRPRTIEYLQQFGVELVDLEGKFVGPFEATRRLSQALAGLEQGDITFIKIAEELGGFRQIGKVIPLLQQFQVAQEALNVAQAGGNSLSADAAKAQQTLAVRLDQVQEKFTALIRSISDTIAFKAMATTAIALAEAIVKVGDAIKPVLPLLSGLAAFRLIKGFGGFAGNVSKNLQGFNSGGLVPGTGNRDTVPAMLTPGEFVIRKNSVSKLGAANLASMNRYAAGGVVTPDRNMYGDNPPTNKFLSQGVRRPEFRRQGIDPQGGEEARKIRSGRINVPFGISFASGSPPNNIRSTIKGVRKEASSKARSQIDNALLSSFRQLNPNKNVTSAQEILQQYIQTGATLKAPDARAYSLSKGKSSGKGQRIFDDILNTGIPNIFKEAAAKFGPLNGTAKTYDAKSLLGNSAYGAVQGSFFEAFVRSITNSPISDKDQKENPIFDFTSLKPEELTDLFGTNKYIIPNEFKNAPNAANISSAISKAFNLPNKQVRFFNTGGPVGTDTVPALLTPGEFVVNKKSAQNIGYSSLNRMNKVGKYAAGGVVRDGRNNYGVMPARGGLGFPGSMPTKTQEEFDKVTKKSTSSLVKYGAGVFAVTTALNQMLPAVEENEGAALRFTRAMTDSVTQVVGSIGTLGFALQGLGEKFDIATLMQNKYVAGITAATGAAALVSAGLEALYDSTNRYNQAVKEGNVAEAQRLATASSTAGARQTATVGAGAGAAGIAALLGLTNPIGLLVTGVVAAGVAFTGLNYAADTFQDFLSLFGAQTAIQVKSQTAAKIATQNFTNELQKASERAASAFTEAQGSGNFAGVGERVFGKLVDRLDALRDSSGDVFNADIKRLPEAQTRRENTDLMLLGMGEASPQQFGKADRANAERRKALISGSQVAKDFFSDSSNFSGNAVENFAEALKEVGISSVEAEKYAKSLSASLKETGELYQQQSKAVKSAQPFINQSFRSSAISGQFSGERLGRSQQLVDRINTNEREVGVFNELIKGIQNDSTLSESEKQQQLRVPTAQRDALSSSVDRAEAELVNTLNNIVQNSDQLSPSLKKLITSLPTAQAVELARGLTNAGAEIERLQKRFELINLGLSPFNANVTASNVALKNYLSSVDGSSTELERSFNTLTAALSASGSGVSDADFSKSVESVSNTLKEFGANDKTIGKVQKRLGAGRATQNALQDFVSSLEEEDLNSLKATGDVKSAQNRIADELAKKLANLPIDEVVAKQIVSDFRNNPPSEALTKAFDSGDISGFQNALGEISSEFINQLAPSIKKVIESEKLLDGALKKRIEAENQLYAAQTKSIAIQLEAAAIQSQYGGAFLSTADKLANLTKSINVGAGGAGVDPVQASAAGLSQRIQDISVEFGKVTRSSTEGAAQQKRLQNLAEQTITQTRQLIKIRQEEYESIKRRNALEKESVDNLISGDVDAFFKSQASQGALGAIASGRGDLAQQFGGEALSGAVEFLNKLRTSGETEFQGQKISGPGGLEERARIAALTARGVTNPELALRSAQIGADTTPELNAAAVGIREGAEVLKQAGELQMQLAQNQVIEAQNVYVNAKGKLGENVKAATTEAQTLQQSQKAAIKSATSAKSANMFSEVGRLHSDAFYIDSRGLSGDVPSYQRKRFNSTQRRANEQTLTHSLQNMTGEQIRTGPGGNVKFMHHQDSSGAMRTIATLEKTLVEKLPAVLRQSFEAQSGNKFNTRDSHNTEQAVEFQKGANVFKDTVEKFVGFTPTLKLDTTNLVVTLNANQLLEKMPQFVLDHAKPLIQEAIENASVGPDGKLQTGTGSTLPS